MSRQLKIGIDIRPYLKDKSGMGQYVYQLTKHLIDQDTLNKYILFSDQDFHIEEFEGKTSKIVSSFFKGKLSKLNIFIFHSFTILFAKSKCDIYITTSALYVPAIRRNFAIMVVHDLTVFKFPKLHTFKTKFLTKIPYILALKNSRNIVCVSNSTKNDLLERFPDTDLNKIKVIYQGRNTDLLNEVDNANGSWKEIKEKFGIKDRYILFVGTLEPRKNILNLIKAFEILSKKLNDNIQLVIAGKKGWGYQEIAAYIENVKKDIKDKILITGFISDKEKAYLYKNAKIFVYPSIYEGFGIPILDAMQFNIPFITTNVSSLPEVTGNAGLLISNPHNTNELFQNMLKLIQDEQLRSNLIEKEKERINMFDWNKCADEFIKLYGSQKV